MSAVSILRRIPVAGLGLCGALLLPGLTQAQTLPGLSGESPLQQSIGNAVAKMCLNALDGNAGNDNTAALTPAQHDLHDQCHAIAVTDIIASGGGGGAASALAALQQVSGNEVAAQGALATRVAAGQFANIAGRLNALRFGANSVISQGRVADNGGNGPGESTLASAGPQTFYFDRSMIDAGPRGDDFAPSLAPSLNMQTGTLSNTAFVNDNGAVRMAQAGDTGSGSATYAPAAAAPPNPWGLFVQGSYNSGHHDQTSNEDQFDFHAASVTGGVDYNFGSAVVGASVGYDDYNAGFGTIGALVSGGAARVQGTSGSLYSAYFGQNWTFSGIATYGHLSTDLTRIVNYTVTFPTGVDPQPDLTAQRDHCSATACTVTVNNTLRGDPDGHTVAVGATAGYQYSAAGWDLMPSLSVNYRRASFSSFSESAEDPNSPGGGLALAFNDQSVDSLRSILGLDVSRPISTVFGVLTPVIRAEWDHEFKTGARSVFAHYANDPSVGNTTYGANCLSCFSLPTDASPANYGIAGGGVSVTLSHRVQAFVYDEVLFGFANYRSNSIAFGVRAQL